METRYNWMMDMLSEQRSSGERQCKGEKKRWFITASVMIVIIVTSLAVNNSFKSKSIVSQKNSIFNSETTRSYLNMNNILDNEIAIPYLRRDIHEKISKFRCTASENNIQIWQDRLCIFQNTCYNKDTGYFYYFQPTQGNTKPVFYDSAKRMLFQFSENNDGAGFLSLSTGASASWAPIVTNESYPMKSYTRLRQLHTLMKYYFAEGNIGHGLWEDLGSISYSMDRMNVADRKLVIMHLGKISNSSLTQTYHQYAIPALTDNPMIEFEAYVASFNTKYICFDNLMVGGHLVALVNDKMKENHGREALFYNWRSKIIQYNGFDPKFIPKKHHIIITNKSNSLWTHSGAKRHRAIANLEQVEQFVRLTYPTISTEVVEWHKMAFNQQIEKLLSTTILITPCGGVSFIIPLLPHGAHAIVMDYYVNMNAFGFQPGQSGSMDAAFLNHIPHVRMQYYQVYGSEDYELDFPGATNTRESASIIVNMTRLQLLMDKALEEMEF